MMVYYGWIVKKAETDKIYAVLREALMKLTRLRVAQLVKGFSTTSLRKLTLFDFES